MGWGISVIGSWGIVGVGVCVPGGVIAVGVAIGVAIGWVV